MSEPVTQTRSSPRADDVIATLRAHQPELRTAGIIHLSLFGPAARGDMGPDDDVELAVKLDPDAHIGLIGLSGLEQRIEKLIRHTVELVPESVETPHVRASIERDRKRAF